jgi:hypothetical protein
MATALTEQDRFISLVENFSMARISGFWGTVAATAHSSTFFPQLYSREVIGNQRSVIWLALLMTR